MFNKLMFNRIPAALALVVMTGLLVSCGDQGATDTAEAKPYDQSGPDVVQPSESVTAGETPAMEFEDLWGPTIGSLAPHFAATDTEGNLRALQDLTGEKGLLIFFNRSTNW